MSTDGGDDGLEVATDGQRLRVALAFGGDRAVLQIQELIGVVARLGADRDAARPRKFSPVPLIQGQILLLVPDFPDDQVVERVVCVLPRCSLSCTRRCGSGQTARGSGDGDVGGIFQGLVTAHGLVDS